MSRTSRRLVLRPPRRRRERAEQVVIEAHDGVYGRRCPSPNCSNCRNSRLRKVRALDDTWEMT